MIEKIKSIAPSLWAAILFMIFAWLFLFIIAPGFAIYLFLVFGAFASFFRIVFYFIEGE